MQNSRFSQNVKHSYSLAVDAFLNEQYQRQNLGGTYKKLTQQSNKGPYNRNNVYSTIPQCVSSQDEEQYQKKQHQKMKNKLLKHKQANVKMVVGTGFSFDITQFFKFKKIQKIQAHGVGLFQSISGGHLAWLILIYSVCNAAIIPPWIMSIQANKILRISWRFFLQALVIIPFVFYQKRSASEQVQRKYSLSHIFTIEGLKKIYLSSLGTTIWFTIVLTCFEWTYISHALIFGGLSNFFLSLSRSRRKANHELEPGGQIFVILGILFVLTDSYTLNINELPSYVQDVVNPYYLYRESYQRVIADLVNFYLFQFALSAAYIMSKFSQMTTDLKTYYPPFLSMFLVNISVSFHVALSAYFFNGATFNMDPNYGIFGLFTDVHFGVFFYMSIILSLGMFISFALISKLFSDPIIPALTMTLQPILSTFFLQFAGIQIMPGSYSIFGYILVMCGLFLILIGQCMFQRKKQIEQKQKQVQQQIKEKLMHSGVKKRPSFESQMGLIQETKAPTIKVHSLKRPPTLINK